MRSFCRLQGRSDNLARRRVGVRTGNCAGIHCVAGRSLIRHSINSSVPIIRNVESPVASYRKPCWLVLRLFWGTHRACKSIGRYFALTGGFIALELLEYNVVALLWKRRPIPRTMKGDKHAAS